MIGFAISTLFMLGIEVRLFIREKIYLQKNWNIPLHQVYNNFQASLTTAPKEN
jgi:hypothetical protein